MNPKNSLYCKGRFGIVCLSLAVLAIMLSAPPAQSYSTYLRVGVSDTKTRETYQTEYLDQTNASAMHSYDTRYDIYGCPYSASASGSLNLAGGEMKFFMTATGYEASTDVAVSFMDKIFPSWNDPTRTDPITINSDLAS